MISPFQTITEPKNPVDENIINEIKKLFSILDQDKSGDLSRDEVEELLKKLYGNSIHVTHVKVESIIRSMDQNNDGKIELDEFLDVMYQWVQENGGIGMLNIERASGQSKDTDLKILHCKMAQYFVEPQLTQLEEQIYELEQNNELINNLSKEFYLAYQEVPNLSAAQKDHINQAHQINKSIDEVLNLLFHSDPVNVKKGLLFLLIIIQTAVYLNTSNQRVKYAQLLISIFENIKLTSINRLIEICLTDEEIENVFVAFKILTIFASGPRLVNVPSNSDYSVGSLVYKTILEKARIFQTIDKYIKHEAKEIQGQVLLLVGNLCRNNLEMRHLFIQSQFHKVLIDIQDSQGGEVQHYLYLSWALSILSGVTQPVEQQYNDYDIHLCNFFIDLFVNLDHQKEDFQLISINSIMALSYLLPFNQINEENKIIWEDIVRLFKEHNDFNIQKACLFVIRNIFNYSIQLKLNMQSTFLLLDCRILDVFAAKLATKNTEIKCFILELIDIVVNNYTQSVFNSEIIKFLFLCEQQTSQIRQMILRIFLSFIQKTNKLGKSLFQFEFLRFLLEGLKFIKEIDLTLKNLYQSSELVYNLDIMSLIFESLFTMVESLIAFDDNTNGLWEIATKNLCNIDFLSALQQFILTMEDDIVTNTIDTLLLKTELDSALLQYKNFLQSLVNFVSTKLEPKNTIRIAVELPISQMVQTVKVLEGQLTDQHQLRVDFAKTSGDNFMIKSHWENLGEKCEHLTVPQTISLVELFINMEFQYKRSPLELFLIEENSNYSNLSIEGVFDIKKKFIMEQSFIKKKIPYMQIIVFDQSQSTMRQFLNTQIDNHQFFVQSESLMNVDITTCEGVIFIGNRNLNTFISQLSNQTKVNPEILSVIVEQFTNVSNLRAINQGSTSFSMTQFLAVLDKNGIGKGIGEHVFNALDSKQTGYVDIRDFVCMLAILYQGSFEDKLKYAFKAYDEDNNGFLDRKEIYRMFTVTFLLQNALMEQSTLVKLTEDFFQIADQNQDNQISFTQFKLAIEQKPEIIGGFLSVFDHRFEKRYQPFSSIFKGRY